VIRFKKLPTRKTAGMLMVCCLDGGFYDFLASITHIAPFRNATTI
jgi:hypothetical protein